MGILLTQTILIKHNYISMTILAFDWGLVIEKLILIAVVVFGSLGIALYTTFGERKVATILQDRPGPNRAGPFGLLQPLADGIKLIMKEEIIPTAANKWLFILGPGLAMTASLMTCAVIPWGSDIELFGRKIALQIADINIGILYVFGDGLGFNRIVNDHRVFKFKDNCPTTGTRQLVEYCISTIGFFVIFHRSIGRM